MVKFTDLPATTAPGYNMSNVERVGGAITALGGVATLVEIVNISGLTRAQVREALQSSKAINVPTGIWRIDPVIRAHHCPACGRECAVDAAELRVGGGA